MGASAGAAACYKRFQLSQFIGFIGAQFSSKGHMIFYCNSRSLGALDSAGLVTAHNTLLYGGRRTAEFMRKLDECTSTRAALENNKEAMAAVVNWYETSLRILAGKGNTVFYTGKWCTADPVYSGQQQFSPLLNVHIHLQATP
jgi:hypothetical protein